MFIYDLVEPQTLLRFARDLEFANLQILEAFLPNREIDDLEYRFTKGNLVDEDAAEFRAWDTPAPIGKRQGLTRVSGELPGLSKKYKLGEEERLRMRSLLTGANGDIIRQILDDVRKGVRALRARMELARGQALYTGKVTISENGFVGEADFGMEGPQFVAPSTLWSDPEATMIEDETTWIEQYVDRSGGAPPGVALVSKKIVGDMRRNNDYRNLLGNQIFTPPLVNRTTINQIRQDNDLPPLFVFDTKVRVNGTPTRVIPEDRLIYLPSDVTVGETLWGVTAEALELQEAGMIVAEQAPGIVSVVLKEFDPVGRWTKTAGIGLPVIGNPETIMVADVR